MCFKNRKKLKQIAKDLEEAYLKISDEISKVDQQILKPNTKEELLKLIEQRKAVQQRLTFAFTNMMEFSKKNKL